ncbi:LTA synthase family protein, partial [Clostridium cadaveris]|nr:LTA synthase family protein [Clostridium cadaveris]
MDIKQFAKDKVSTIDKTFIMRTILFVIVTVGLLLKSFIFLGFTLNENIYSLNFSLGYNEGTYFYKYYLAFILAFLSFYFLFKNRGKLRFLF